MNRAPEPEASFPEISVVVPSVNGWLDLEGCLEALTKQAEDVRLEIIVADRCGEDLRARVREVYPAVRVCGAPRATTIPDLRALAFRAAKGTAVAVIEDHVLVPPGWAKQMLRAREAGALVIGGSVENAANETWVDRAAFLCEYSHLLPPLAPGPSSSLTGNNTLYDAELLERYREVTEEGQWENHLHEAFLADGIELICRPEIRVAHKMHYTFWGYMSQRFLYSRSYSGRRLARAGLPKRIAFGLLSFLLPPVLLWRISSSIFTKEVDRTVAIRSMPLIGLFVTAWAFGDAVGAWFGPGRALEKVR